MNISGISNITSLLPEMGKAVGSSQTTKSNSFSNLVSDTLNDVNSELKNADKMSQEFVTEGKHDLHEVLIELEKADMSFKYMSQVRNKVLDAYQEIMRIQV